jgi:hypothetical protein
VTGTKGNIVTVQAPTGDRLHTKEKNEGIVHQGMTAARRRTATAIANEWIPALASTTFELMKPP